MYLNSLSYYVCIQNCCVLVISVVPASLTCVFVFFAVVCCFHQSGVRAKSFSAAYKIFSSKIVSGEKIN